jgi:hypothetical protein
VQLGDVKAIPSWVHHLRSSRQGNRCTAAHCTSGLPTACRSSTPDQGLAYISQFGQVDDTQTKAQAAVAVTV